MSRRCRRLTVRRSLVIRLPQEVILLPVRRYLRYGLAYRDVEELLAERGVEVDHVTIYRWVQRFTPLLIDAARPCRHAVGGRWFVDETCVKVAGKWRYVYRAVDQSGQVIDVLVSRKRDFAAARKFFTTALTAHGEPDEVVTDSRVECDHGRLKSRLRPMRGLKRDRTASVVIRGHAFIQNIGRGRYELATEATRHHGLIAAFNELGQVT